MAHLRRLPLRVRAARDRGRRARGAREAGEPPSARAAHERGGER